MVWEVLIEHGCLKLTLISSHGVTGSMFSVDSSHLSQRSLYSVTGITGDMMRWTLRTARLAAATAAATRIVFELISIPVAATAAATRIEIFGQQERFISSTTGPISMPKHCLYFYYSTFLPSSNLALLFLVQILFYILPFLKHSTLNIPFYIYDIHSLAIVSKFCK